MSAKLTDLDKRVIQMNNLLNALDGSVYAMKQNIPQSEKTLSKSTSSASSPTQEWATKNLPHLTQNGELNKGGKKKVTKKKVTKKA